MWLCLRDPKFNRLRTIPTCDGQSNGRTQDDSIYRDSIESRDKIVRCY